MNLFKTFAMVGLVGVVLAPTRVLGDDFTPTLSIQTNSESFYYPRDKTIWKAPMLRIRTNLTPFTSYWANHFREIHGIKGKSPERLYFQRSIITKFVTKNIPSITDEYFKDIDCAVDGSDLCYPAQKGVPFKELADSIDEVTPLPYHGKLCVISDITKGNLIIGCRISILDEKTGKKLQYFTVIHDPAKNNDPLGDLQWVDDRYIIQTFSARHWTSVHLIDLQNKKISYGIESGLKELISAFVLNGKVMLLSDGALNEYPLKH